MIAMEGGEDLGDRQLKLTLEAELESLKRFKHVQPRIDPDYYQAEIGEMITVDSQPEDHDFEDLTRQAKIDWYQGTRSTSSRKHDKEINEFLSMTRNIFEPFKYANDNSWNESNAIIPLESDAVAIEYLSEHNWDPEAAFFHFSADMSLGKETVFVKKIQDQVSRQPTAALFSEMKDRIFLNGAQTTMYGAYENPAASSLREAGAANGASTGTSNGKDLGTKGKSGSSHSTLANYYAFPFPREYALEKIEGKATSAAADEKNASATGKKKDANRGVSKDKQETKKRWDYIYNVGTALLKQVGEAGAAVSYSVSAKKDPRATMQDVQNLLDEAALLSPLLDSPGDSFAEEVRILLADMTKALLACRQWSASVRDMLESPLVHHGPRIDHAATDTTDLKGLLQASDSLVLRPPEVKRLKSLCLALEKVQSASKKFLLPEPSPLVNEEHEEVSKKGRKKNMSKKKQEADAVTPDLPPKPQLEELNKLLQFARPLPIRLPCVDDYEKLYADAWSLVKEVEEVYERSETCRVRDKLRHLQAEKRPTLDQVRALRDRVDRFPLQLPTVHVGEKLDNLIWEGEEWQEEVMAIANDQRGGKSGKQSGVSIKRVESLIHEGERLVFDFSEELNILRTKQIQAKEWLEKLKSSFKTKQKGSLRGKMGENKQGAVKMGLEDMKMMVEQGSSMIDEGDNGRSGASRELNKAQSAVDIAEEWLNRVKEVLAQGIAGGDLSDLRELIRESDEMPVYMEEAVVMKSHLNAMEWAKKAAKVLYVKKDKSRIKNEDKEVAEETDEDGEPRRPDVSGTPDGRVDAMEIDEGKDHVEFARPRMAEVQKLAKEIGKIRDQVPTDVSEEFSLPKLREENDCLAILRSAEEWMNSTKRMMQGGAIRKGTRLERVVRFYKEGLAFHLNFDQELKPLKMAIQNAERWLRSNERILKQLGIEMTTPYVLDNLGKTDIKAEKEGKEGVVSAPDDAMDVSTEPPEDSNVSSAADEVSVGALERISLTAESLSVVFPEADAAKERLTEVEEWSSRVAGICKAGQVPAANRDTKKKAASLNTANLANLLKEAEEFHVDISRERALISDTIKASETWKNTATPILQRILTQDIITLTSKMVEAAKLEPGKISAAFKTNKDVDLTSLDLEEEIDDDRLLGMVTTVVNASKSKRTQDHLRAAQAARQANASVTHQYPMAQASLSGGVPQPRPVIPTNAALSGHAGTSMGQLQSGVPAAPPRPVTEGPFMDQHLRQANACLSSLISLKSDGRRTGISSPLTVQIDLCVAAMEWIKDAMALLHPTNYTTAIAQPGKERSWADASEESIINLLDDCKEIVSNEAKDAVMSLLEGTRLAEVSQSSIEIKQSFEAVKKDPIADQGRAFERLQAIVDCKGKRSVIRPKYDPKKEAERLEKERQAKEAKEGGEGEEEDDDSDDNDDDEEQVEKRPSRKRVRTAKVVEDAPRRRGRAAAAAAVAEEIAGPAGEEKKSGDTAVKSPTKNPEDAKDSEGSESEEEIDQTKKFAPFRRLLMEGSVSLPAEMQRLVEVWSRCLGSLLYRVYEVEAWTAAAKRTLQRSIGAPPASPQKRCFEDVLYLLKYSDLKGIDGQARIKIEDEVMKFSNWIDKAHKMKRREKGHLLGIDELKSFCKSGENLMFDAPIVSEMRAELKKAKNWLNRLHATGIEKGLAMSSDLIELLPEADLICCNLTTYCESIHATTKSYCLCRQAYFGLMIGCDFCDEWFHITCIGCTKTQADKLERYSCARCTVERSFAGACKIAARLANKWSDKAEFDRSRALTRQSATMARAKAADTLKQLQVALDEQKKLVEAGLVEITDSTTTEVPIVRPVDNITDTVVGRIEFDVNKDVPQIGARPVSTNNSAAAVFVPRSLQMDPKKRSSAAITRDLETARDILDKADQVLADLANKEAFEDKNKKDIANWMKTVQAIIWPGTSEATRDGAPLGSKLCRSPFDYLEGNALSSEKMMQALAEVPVQVCPPRIVELARLAFEGKYDFAQDVNDVIEAFRWMSWCSLLLNVTRSPPTTQCFRNLIQLAHKMKYADNNILRGLQAILHRAKAWKTKTKSFLRFNLRRMELSTANNLLIDGNMIPFSSRVKQVLQSTVKHGQTMVPASQIVDGQAVDVSGGPGGGGGGRGRGGGRGQRGAEKRGGGRRGPRKVEPTETPQLPLYVTCTNDFPDSSDDEDDSAAIKQDPVLDEDATPIEMLNTYNLWSNHIIVGYKELWPVKIEFGPLNPKGTLFDMLPSAPKRPSDDANQGGKSTKKLKA